MWRGTDDHRRSGVPGLANTVHAQAFLPACFLYESRSDKPRSLDSHQAARIDWSSFEVTPAFVRAEVEFTCRKWMIVPSQLQKQDSSTSYGLHCTSSSAHSASSGIYRMGENPDRPYVAESSSNSIHPSASQTSQARYKVRVGRLPDHLALYTLAKRRTLTVPSLPRETCFKKPTGRTKNSGSVAIGSRRSWRIYRPSARGV